MIAPHCDVFRLRLQDDVVVQVDRLENRPQFVITVLPGAEDFEAEITLLRADREPPGEEPSRQERTGPPG